MFSTVILVILTLTVTFFLMRTILVIIGLYKDPILHRFEKYGDDEDYYYPLPPLLGWLGAFLILSDRWFVAQWGVSYAFTFLGIILIFIAYLTFQYPELMGSHPELFLSYPRWLANLRDRTTRLERRRMAYMWLRLPWKLRLIYNSNDRAFNQWADMIIMSTVM